MGTPQNNNVPKTVEEHRQFLQDWVRLHLWHVWHWASLHPQEPFVQVLRQRADIYRKTDLNPFPSKNSRQVGNLDDPRWVELEKRIERIWQQHCRQSDEFESLAWEVLQEVVEARAQRDLEEGDNAADYQCDSLRYNEPVPGRTRVGFHIRNAVAPRSIFDDPHYLPHCMLDLIAKVRVHGITEAGTGTWLNSHPRWLELFPQAWMDHMSPPNEDIGWSYSHWGQFINARGLLNHALAARLRATGRLPYACRSSWIALDQWQDHLLRLLQARSDAVS